MDEQKENQEVKKKPLLGLLLVYRGIITYEQLDLALKEQKKTGKRLGEVLIDLGFIDKETLDRYLEEQKNI